MSKSNHEGPPEGRGKRFFKLAGMTSSVFGSYARDRLRAVFSSEEETLKRRAATYAEAGQRIAQTLGELKGAVMKVGQMASIGNELLPPELQQALKSLQGEAPPVPFGVIESQIERELGASPEVLFRRFEREPFAAASIGQVHRATTDEGREVVVKVQYPGVDASVDSDLYQLKLALRAAGVVRLRRKVLDELFSEVRARLREELDYTNEAENVRSFREFHHEHGDASVVVPEVVGERSSQRVLTLSYEPGDPLAQVRELGYDQATRDRLGRNLVRMVASQLFDHGAVHADPNPANFSCRRDGTLVVYDFGCVKRLEPWILEAYRELMKAFLAADFARLDSVLIKVGARDPEGPEVPSEAYETVREIFLPLFSGDEPYDFGQSPIQRQLLTMVPQFRRHRASFQPPVAIVYVNRVIGGHAMNLRQLQARVALMGELSGYLRGDSGTMTS